MNNKKSRGRAPGFKMPESHRDKIKNSNILNRLITHIETDGGVLNATQVTAALGLLKKVLPDVSQTQITGEEGGPVSFNIITKVPDSDLD